jgi:hypothetical protein
VVEGNAAPGQISPLARKSRDLLRAVSPGALVNVWLFGQIKSRGLRHTFVSVCWGPPMTCQIRATAEELEHAIIVNNDIMSEGENKEKGSLDKTFDWKILFEPLIGCMHPIIASGATPIGSADHAPNRK